MLATEKQTTLNALLSEVSHDELVWINGYISGVLSTGPETESRNKTESLPLFKGKVTLAYGTETGNAKSLATRLTAVGRKRGIHIRTVSLEQYRLNDLEKEEYFIVVISTQGDGEPPLGAKGFYDFIHESRPALQNVQYAVLALGDRSYPLFCQTGVDVDMQLHKAGANRIVDLIKCDTDYEQAALQWFEALLNRLQDAPQAISVSSVINIPQQQSRKQLYSGTILCNVNLNDEASDKQTHHIEIATEGAAYLPGDSLSLVPENPLQVVQHIIAICGIDADESIVYRGEENKVLDLLQNKLNIIRLPERTVKQYAKIVSQDIPEAKISLIDLLKIYPVKNAAQFREVLDVLEPLTPRQYSIASAPQTHGTELHLIVARDSFLVNEEQKYGLCSNYLTQLTKGTKFQFYIHPNNRFRQG